MGLQFETCNTLLFDAFFRKCQLNLCSFYQCKLKKFSFVNCGLKESDFSEADLTEANFSYCDLQNVTFDNTTLLKTDFTTAQNYAFDPDKNYVKGAKFSKAGVAGLLEKYQIVVK